MLYVLCVICGFLAGSMTLTCLSLWFAYLENRYEIKLSKDEAWLTGRLKDLWDCDYFTAHHYDDEELD